MSDSYVVILIGRNSAVSVVLQGFKQLKRKDLLILF